VKLKRIKAFGFKTFAEPTTVEFSGGITAIVGPNGSGKSNLVDAFRWVLGETSTRSLRSGKLEDVIFAGNDKRKPLGLAEISITFDNSDRALPIDFAEVEITRRAYRAGESEFFINREQVRLRDVHDLLMGSGLGPGSYAIVSQGQIDAILTSKPAERRVLFEETAGISRFLARKHESLRRLEQTEANAIRISDLIAEIDRRIPELDTQVRRAKRYRRINARVRDLEILSYLRASASRREEREGLRRELAGDDERRASAAAAVASIGAQLAQTRTHLYRQDLLLEELRTQAQSRRGDLAKAESEYAAALARREALESQSTQNSEDVVRVTQERESLVDSIRSIEERLTSLATDGSQGQDVHEAQIARSRATVETAENAVIAAQAALAHAESAYREHAGELKAAESRLQTIEELENALEGHVPGTRAAVEAWQRGELVGIDGVVSNLIEIEERYARAMDVAFGARLSNIVTRTAADAERAIEYLNRTELGRATFMPLETLPKREARTLPVELSKEAGVVGYAPRLVRTQPKYTQIVEFLVGGVLVVDTLATGIRLVRERGVRETIVTLAGEQIVGGAAITGGRFKRERSILSRRAHAQTLRERLAAMRTEFEKLDADLHAARLQLETSIGGRDVARGALAKSELALAEVRAALGAERDATAARLTGLERDAERTRLAREQMLADISSLAEQTRSAHRHIEGLRHGITSVDAELDNARRERESLVDRQTALEGELHVAETAERDIAALGESSRTRLAQIEAELGMLVSQFAQNPATDDECRDVEERYRTEADSVVDELPRLRDELVRLVANVNLNAETEREETAERERFLRTQLDDLSRAREALLESIKEIEQQTQARFNETFEQVARAFSSMYAKLFEGGSARMWQTNPENLSETGIEIAVQPPGKKQMPLPALSGGERAMTAAALIFALISVKPSPFYLLDEVDAAMDDVNVGRFSDMVAQLAGNSDMIIVTHNKKTMEQAGRIYGVTMGELGISAIVSVELTERWPEPAIA